MHKTTLHMTLPADMARRLAILAAARRVSRSELLRQAAARYLDEAYREAVAPRVIA